METWEHLTPEQKQQARQLYSQLKDLPPERRQKVRTAIRDLSVMPPGQRQQVIESDRFKSEFSPQERGPARQRLAIAAGPGREWTERARPGRLTTNKTVGPLIVAPSLVRFVA